MNNKVVNKKKKKSKLARVFQEIGKSLAQSLKNGVQKFKKTSKEFKIILVVWILVLIVLLIVSISVKANKKTALSHEKMENNIKIAALKYVKDKNLYPTVNQKLRLNIDVFIQNGYLYKESISDNTCSGYTLVYYDENNEDYVIEPYLSCKSYITKGYEVK